MATIMLASLKIIKRMGKEHLNIMITGNILEAGDKIKCMVKDSSNGRMANIIKAFMKKIWNMAMEKWYIVMEQFMRAIGMKENKMEKEYLRINKATKLKVYGRMA